MPTILELFRGSDLDKQVKPDKGTLFSQIKSFGEQELLVLGVKIVELNNPLIYGNSYSYCFVQHHLWINKLMKVMVVKLVVQ